MPLVLAYHPGKYAVLDKTAGIDTYSFVETRKRQLINFFKDVGETVLDTDTLLIEPVHRLDKPTSGCLVVGLSQQSITELEDAFRIRSVKKQYYAIVRGRPGDDSGVIRDH